MIALKLFAPFEVPRPFCRLLLESCALSCCSCWSCWQQINVQTAHSLPFTLQTSASVPCRRINKLASKHVMPAAARHHTRRHTLHAAFEIMLKRV